MAEPPNSLEAASANVAFHLPAPAPPTNNPPAHPSSSAPDDPRLSAAMSGFGLALAPAGVRVSGCTQNVRLPPHVASATTTTGPAAGGRRNTRGPPPSPYSQRLCVRVSFVGSAPAAPPHSKNTTAANAARGVVPTHSTMHRCKERKHQTGAVARHRGFASPGSRGAASPSSPSSPEGRFGDDGRFEFELAATAGEVLFAV